MSENQVEKKRGWSGISFFFAGLFLAIFMTGCNNDVDLVKNGVMNFNKTITVGEAFDNWKDCANSKWNSFKTDNHVKVVEFTCEEKNVKDYFHKIKSFLPKNEQKKADYLDVVSSKQVFQWTINKDNTFQIDNVQFKTTWADGKKFSHSQNPMEQVKSVYNNEITCNFSEINKMSAAALAYTFKMLKERAK